MKMDRLSKARRTSSRWSYRIVDHLYLPLDRQRLRRSQNLHLIPRAMDSRRGKTFLRRVGQCNRNLPDVALPKPG